MSTLPAGYALLLGLTVLQRAAELALSRHNLRRQDRSGGGPAPIGQAAGSSAEYRVMVALHAALILAPALEVSLRGRGAPLAVAAAAVALWALAQVLRYWSVHALGRSWNVRAIVDPSTPAVSSGPYRFVRHPNYLAVVLEFIAIPAAGGAWVALVLLNLAHAPVLRRRILAEEQLLSAMPGWLESMGAKGRLLPRLRRRAHPGSCQRPGQGACGDPP